MVQNRAVTLLSTCASVWDLAEAKTLDIIVPEELLRERCALGFSEASVRQCSHCCGLRSRAAIGSLDVPVAEKARIASHLAPHYYRGEKFMTRYPSVTPLPF